MYKPVTDSGIQSLSYARYRTLMTSKAPHIPLQRFSPALSGSQTPRTDLLDFAVETHMHAAVWFTSPPATLLLTFLCTVYQV